MKTDLLLAKWKPGVGTYEILENYVGIYTDLVYIIEIHYRQEMADDESSKEKANLALQTVNNPLTMKLMFTRSPENALDTDDVLSQTLQSIPHNH